MSQDNNTEHAADIKLTDAIGNKLSMDSLVHFVNPQVAFGLAIGKVVGYTPEGIIQKGTPARLRVVIDITITVPPGNKVIPALLRVPNPESEQVISEILDKGPKLVV